ncbi:MAG: rhomboid family intramembrane serine protease [Pseudobdellovibrio sp.]
METADFNLPEGLLIRKVRAHWLTKNPDTNSYYMAAASLILLLVCNFLYWRNDFNIADLITAVPHKVFEEHQYWRLWTALFAHADIAHLFSNSLLFSVFAYFLFGYFGSFVFPFAAFLFGGITNYLVLKTMSPESELLGVSGVVYWMGAVWLTLYFLLETRDRLSKRFIKTLGIALVLFVPETYHQDVSYLSHFIGFVFGIAFALVYYQIHKQRFQKAEIVELVEA